MEHKKPFDSFSQDAHQKAQDAIDRATDARTGAEEQRRRRHAGEPHLIRDGKVERCSVCGYPFPNHVKPSMSVAFAEHLEKAHKPGPASEDSSQATLRIVREATEDK